MLLQTPLQVLVPDGPSKCDLCMFYFQYFNILFLTWNWHTPKCFSEWFTLSFILCLLQTDDKGVFATELSQEYKLAATTFGLSQEAVWKLSQQAIDYIFAPDTVKEQLKQKWRDLQPQVFKWDIYRRRNPLNTSVLKPFST